MTSVNYGFLFLAFPIFNNHIRKVPGGLQTCLNHFNCDYSNMDLDLLAQIDEMYAFIEAIQYLEFLAWDGHCTKCLYRKLVFDGAYFWNIGLRVPSDSLN